MDFFYHCNFRGLWGDIPQPNQNTPKVNYENVQIQELCCQSPGLGVSKTRTKGACLAYKKQMRVIALNLKSLCTPET